MKRKYKLPNKEVRDFISSPIQEIDKELKISGMIEKLFMERDWRGLEEVLQSTVMEIMNYFDVPYDVVRYFFFI